MCILFIGKISTFVPFFVSNERTEKKKNEILVFRVSIVRGLRNRFLGFFLDGDGVFFPAQKYLSQSSLFSLHPHQQSVIKAERERRAHRNRHQSWEKTPRDILHIP